MAAMVWTEKKAAKCAHLYKSGKSLRYLAEKFSVTPITIRNWLLEQGVKLRRQGRPAAV